MPDKIFFHCKLIICGLDYSTFAYSVHNSAVFFQPIGSHDLVPGIMQSNKDGLYGEDLYMVIKRYLAWRAQADNPFLPYNDFEVELWLDRLADDLDIIVSMQQIFYSIEQCWDSGLMALKPLDRVHQIHIVCSAH